jgi:anti-sigma factor RsiW
MDHEEALQARASTRYILGDLSATERDAFEEHFADCSHCMKDVEVSAIFAANARSLFQERSAFGLPTPKSDRPRRRIFGLGLSLWPATIAACLALAGVVGYQNAVEIPMLHANLRQLDKPQVLSASPLLPPSSRESAPSVAVPAGALFFRLSLATDVLHPGERYQCELRSQSGRVLWNIPVEAPPADGVLNLLIPGSRFSTGHYSAVLRRQTPTGLVEDETYHFVVNVR